MSIKSVCIGACLLFSSHAAFTMAPQENLLLNRQQNQEVRQRRPLQSIQLHRVVIDQEEIDLELGINTPPKSSSNNFAQEGKLYIRSIKACLMLFFPKKTSTKKYQHGEFPV